VLKARLPSSERIDQGQITGLRFDPRTVTLFDAESGAALKSEANEKVLSNG
jgi:multiple sugar transport system ATP-binding protein